LRQGVPLEAVLLLVLLVVAWLLGVIRRLVIAVLFPVLLLVLRIIRLVLVAVPRRRVVLSVVGFLVLLVVVLRRGYGRCLRDRGARASTGGALLGSTLLALVTMLALLVLMVVVVVVVRRRVLRVLGLGRGGIGAWMASVIIAVIVLLASSVDGRPGSRRMRVATAVYGWWFDALEGCEAGIDRSDVHRLGAQGTRCGDGAPVRRDRSRATTAVGATSEIGGGGGE